MIVFALKNFQQLQQYVHVLVALNWSTMKWEYTAINRLNVELVTFLLMHWRNYCVNAEHVWKIVRKTHFAFEEKKHLRLLLITYVSKPHPWTMIVQSWLNNYRQAKQVCLALDFSTYIEAECTAVLRVILDI